MITNAGLRPGQSLVLTKALGIGVLSTAIGRVYRRAAIAAAVASMTRLNAERPGRGRRRDRAPT